MEKLYLSKRGHITLIKNTLSNFPMCFLSLFPLSARVANRIERIFYSFLWGGIVEENFFT